VLVYGPGVKGNMAALLKLAATSWPLPLGSLTARRSLLSLDNLTSAIDAVLSVPVPLRRPLIVADPEPLNVPDIVASLRLGLGRKPGLVAVPPFMLRLGALLAGRSEDYGRLAGALVASPEALIKLGWQPACSTREGLARLARESSSGG
jgi:UDP-glucose 4-epimerase